MDSVATAVFINGGNEDAEMGQLGSNTAGARGHYGISESLEIYGVS